MAPTPARYLLSRGTLTISNNYKNINCSDILCTPAWLQLLFFY
ncbi:hypothetical protein FHS03_000997 [Massilia violacea]|uniref:Uncharacterized protein n=1 Tax=Pseudoduganella violacea TaxID=1715466 RepID=A0A7W5B7Q3_9BURK|nr:hypothetical protein [Pseudoduganella violacea]